MRAVVTRVGFAVVWLRRPELRRLAVLCAPFMLALIWLSMIWGSATDRLTADEPLPA